MENLDAATQLYLIRKIIEAEFPEKMEQFGDNVAMAVAWSFDKLRNETDCRIDAWHTIWDKLKEIDPNIGHYGNTGLECAIRVIENLRNKSEPNFGENGIVSCSIFITPDGEKFYEYEKALEYTETFNEVKQVVLDSISYSEIDNYDVDTIVKNIIKWGNQ